MKIELKENSEWNIYVMPVSKDNKVIGYYEKLMFGYHKGKPSYFFNLKLISKKTKEVSEINVIEKTSGNYFDSIYEVLVKHFKTFNTEKWISRKPVRLRNLSFSGAHYDIYCPYINSDNIRKDYISFFVPEDENNSRDLKVTLEYKKNARRVLENARFIE